jgi:hypothetical protein
MSILPSGGPQKLPFRCYARASKRPPRSLGPASKTAAVACTALLISLRQRGRVFVLTAFPMTDDDETIAALRH